MSTTRVYDYYPCGSADADAISSILHNFREGSNTLPGSTDNCSRFCETGNIPHCDPCVQCYTVSLC